VSPAWSYRVRVRLVRERAHRFGPALRCAADVAEALADELSGLDREHFLCCHLDVKNRLLSRELVSVGHLSSALVHPREVFKGAILANAASVCLAHNHPSGDPEPSREDLELTRRLVRAGELLGIPVLDHVVVAAGGFRSVAEQGIG
jgi:DNA repair protein RadC